MLKSKFVINWIRGKKLILKKGNNQLMFSYSFDIYFIICSLLVGKLMKLGLLLVLIIQREKNLFEK